MYRGSIGCFGLRQRQTCHYPQAPRHRCEGKESIYYFKSYLTEATQITIAVQCLYTAGISTAKISTLILYHRIFANQRFRIAVWAVGVFIATYSFVQFLVVIFQCNPVRGAWDFTVKATCIELMLELQIMGIFNAITDIITVCLPMVMLWRLQMPPRKKAQVVATFLLGGFVCIVSIYRVPKQAQISLVDASCKFHNLAWWIQ